MRRIVAALVFVAAARAQQPQPVTLQQVLSAPYATQLTAAPVGDAFAWVEDAEGVHNLWVATPHTPARQLTHYTEDDAQDIAGLAWSPDASVIAYVYGAEAGNSGKPANPAHLQRDTSRRIILQTLAGGSPPAVIGEGHAPLFSRDGNSLYFLNTGKIFVTCVNKCGKASAVVTQVVFDRGSASSLTLSPHGHQLAFVSTRRSGGLSHSFIGLYTFATKSLRFLAPSTGIDSAPIFSPDGKQIAFLRRPSTEAPEFAANRVSPNPWSIVLADVDDEMARVVFTAAPNQPGSVPPRLATGEPHLLFPANKQLLFFSDADGWVHLYSLGLAGNAQPQLLTGQGDVEDAVLDPDKTRLIYSSTGPGITCVDKVCKKTFAPRESSDIRTVWSLVLDSASRSHQNSGPMTPTTIIAAHPAVLSNGTIVSLVSDARQPMHPAILSSTPAPAFAWHRAPRPESVRDAHLSGSYPAQALVEPQQVIFPSADTLFQLHGQLFLPPGDVPDAKHPAILFFHGGPRRQMLLGYPSMDYYSNAYAFNQYLASRGYVVLSVNYRGGIGYGLNFRQCEHCGADGAAEYADALGAAAYLRSRPDVDPKRIGIWGGSYGGYFVALALARNSDMFAAGVDFHGVHEWSLEDNAKADWLDRPGTTLADQEKIALRAHASSPMAGIDKWRSPVLLIHGDDDPDVAYAQTPLLADALRARKVPVEELIFPDEVHGFLLHKDWLAAYQAASDFFDRTLKPAPTPVK